MSAEHLPQRTPRIIRGAAPEQPNADRPTETIMSKLTPDFLKRVLQREGHPVSKPTGEPKVAVIPKPAPGSLIDWTGQDPNPRPSLFQRRGHGLVDSDRATPEPLVGPPRPVRAFPPIKSRETVYEGLTGRHIRRTVGLDPTAGRDAARGRSNRST